ncbi:MAG: hypothetical protein JWL61_900 [Gemmatimonadetes bacterium]|nr:hypothetical protein [Gemmatimonadota bacterium]
MRVCALVLAMALAACSSEDVIRHFTPPDADARARAYLALFTNRHVDSAVARLVPQLAGPDAERELTKVGAMLEGQQFDSTRVIGAQTNVVAGVRHVNLSYERHAARGWIIANVATVDSAGSWFVEGVSASTIDQPLEERTRFSLRGKSARHYVWLFLTIAAAGISLATGVWIATRRAMPKRWRWVFVSLIGVGAFSLDWATGEIGVRVIHLQLASAGFMRSGPVAPWILTFGVPAGAMVALVRYARWRAGALRDADELVEGYGLLEHGSTSPGPQV